MAKVKIEEGRARINETPNGLEIVIPSKKNVFAILFIGFWLIGWAFGEIFAIKFLLFPGEEFNPPYLFLIGWLGAWTMGGAFAFYTWFWNIRGKEIITVNSEEISYKKDLFGFGKSREYDLSQIKDMRAVSKPSGFWGAQSYGDFWVFSGGTIGFDYGYKTYKIGIGIDEAESKHIINEIAKRFQISVK